MAELEKELKILTNKRGQIKGTGHEVSDETVQKTQINKKDVFTSNRLHIFLMD